MREIKFRAWVKDGWDDSDNIYEMCYDLGFEEYEPINDLLSEVEHLMQYTGLKDKNGKEIYEGDILKQNPNDDEWNDLVVWWPKKAQFELKGFIRHPDPVTMVCLSEVAEGSDNPSIIIGNIHENPELLT